MLSILRQVALLARPRTRSGNLLSTLYSSNIVLQKLLEKFLRDDNKITEIELNFILISNECLKIIITLLNNHLNIKKLQLLNDQIGDAGAISIANALQNNTSLIELNLNQNKNLNKAFSRVL